MNSFGFPRDAWPERRNVYIKGALLHLLGLLLTVAALVSGFFAVTTGTGDESFFSELGAGFYLIIAFIPATVLVLPIYAFVTRLVFKKTTLITFWKRHFLSAFLGGVGALVVYGLAFFLIGSLAF